MYVHLNINFEGEHKFIQPHQETGLKKSFNRKESKKLCLMYIMYHGHTPSYLFDFENKK